MTKMISLILGVGQIKRNKCMKILMNRSTVFSRVQLRRKRRIIKPKKRGMLAPEGDYLNEFKINYLVTI
jgi:hypothetical protein